MKKFIFAAAVLVAGAFAMNAESYNRIGISYNNESFGYNKYAGGSDSNFSTNGIGVDYIHGFGLSEKLPLFLEVGINADFGFGSNSENSDREDLGGGYWMRAKYTEKYQMINFQVPVNIVYRFNVYKDITVAPYFGLNFKLNLAGKFRDEFELDTNIPNDILDEAGFDYSDLKEEGEWVSVFSKDDMGGSDFTWNRFQMGWHIGVGVQYKPFYLGLQYGTDFIPAFSYEKAKVNTGNFKLTVAYAF